MACETTAFFYRRGGEDRLSFFQLNTMVTGRCNTYGLFWCRNKLYPNHELAEAFGRRYFVAWPERAAKEVFVCLHRLTVMASALTKRHWFVISDFDWRFAIWQCGTSLCLLKMSIPGRLIYARADLIYDFWVGFMIFFFQVPERGDSSGQRADTHFRLTCQALNEQPQTWFSANQ